MNYDILIEKKAEKQISEINTKIAIKIFDAIEKLKTTPRPSGCSKLHVFEGYRIRVGDYRILYTVNDNNKLITIYKVSHRASAYN